MTTLPATRPSRLVTADLLPDPLDPVLTRPLAIINGRAYAAAWPYLRPAPTEADTFSSAPTLVIVRDDGLLLPATLPAAALIRLASLPPLPADRLWSTTGLLAYGAGHRPPPAAVFTQLTSVFDRFIDFTGSLAAQSVMAEFCAVYVLATWLLPAFNTFSHLWIIGDTGAGKTRLLHLLTRLSHLGAVIPPFAPTGPLRDLTALGSTLALDNADGVFASLTRGLLFRSGAATVRQGLFLAGARRDVLFPLHLRLSPPDQPAVYGLTHLDVFGPRLFAALQPPPAAAAPRALYLPLLRSTDRARCLADPTDPAAWPVAPRRLTDDLWALSLAHLTELPAHLSATAAGSALVGATFQTWHPFLAVAAWLTAHGVSGLLDRLRRLASDYPRRIRDLAPQAADVTALALQAIYGYVALQIEKIVTTFANPELAATSGDSGNNPQAAGSGGDSGKSGDSPQVAESGGDSGESGDSPQVAGSGGDSGKSGDSGQPRPLSSGVALAAPPALSPRLVAHLNHITYEFSASQILGVMRQQAEYRTWVDLSEHLTPNVVGKTLTALNLVRRHTNRNQFYLITLPQLERFLDAYRLTLPPILSAYPHFNIEAFRASLTPQPSNPVKLAILRKLFSPQPKP